MIVHKKEEKKNEHEAAHFIKEKMDRRVIFFYEVVIKLSTIFHCRW